MKAKIIYKFNDDSINRCFNAQVRETSPPTSRRRRSSLAQLTDILREWGSGGGLRKQDKSLSRRETLADIILARYLHTLLLIP